ncbi:glutamyl-tRNA reductase [bacterium]|nr:glutamyl-tRNA reductase [bacterium]MBU1653167.1 glutamyl-tRNA reductase [bacterium]MBU1882517.1 glutamyl-tRNA reductase [bacterium]
MGLSLCGISYKTASVEDRERFQLRRAELMEATEQYKELSGAAEAVVVSTCNRVEFYQYTPDKSEPLTRVIEFYKQRGINGADTLKELGYVRQKTTVARHLFRVASGMESMVLGEDQVFHQLKEAYSSACAVGGPGKILHKIFHQAFQAGKQVRAETQIGKGPRSVPGAALDLLKERFGDKRPTAALVIGVNELTNILLDGLMRWEIPVYVANRTLAKAEKLVSAYKAKAISLEELCTIIPDVGMIISATSSSQPVLKADHFLPRQGPLYVVDLAVPRDVSPEVGEVEGVRLIGLQDIQKYLDHAEYLRAEDLPKADVIIEEKVSEYSTWRAKLRQQSKILKMHRDLNRLRKEELERFKAGFHISEYRALDSFSQALVKNFMRLLPEVLDDEDEPKKS